MKEYIERDAAIKSLFAKIDAPNHRAEFLYCDEIYNVIQDIPAADVVEVRHGQWIKSESSGLYKCSKCGRYATNSDVLNWEYCNCGAKMDGGADDAAD